MSRLGPTFAQLRKSRRSAFVPFLVAGDPNVATSARAIDVLIDAGADLLELGVPFSDPIADGPINQRAAQRALAAGTTAAGVLDLVRQVRMRHALPIVLLSYYNPILQYGLARFCPDAVAAGVDGLVIPDLPADEADALIAPARAAELDTVFLLAPTSTTERIRLVAGRATGFVYCVSVAGVTGVRHAVADGVAELVRRIRAATDLPVCVGFGVSTPAQARQVASLADGVIVGSALVAALESADGQLGALAQLARNLRTAVDASVDEGE